MRYDIRDALCMRSRFTICHTKCDEKMSEVQKRNGQRKNSVSLTSILYAIAIKESPFASLSFVYKMWPCNNIVLCRFRNERINKLCLVQMSNDIVCRFETARSLILEGCLRRWLSCRLNFTFDQRERTWRSVQGRAASPPPSLRASIKRNIANRYMHDHCIIAREYSQEMNFIYFPHTWISHARPHSARSTESSKKLSFSLATRLRFVYLMFRALIFDLIVARQKVVHHISWIVHDIHNM